MGRAELIVKNGKYKNRTALKNEIDYAVSKKNKQRHKVGRVRFAGGVGVDYTDTDKAVRQMRAIKKYYGKTSGRQLYHYYLSFTKDVEDAQQVYMIGKIIAEDFFYGHQVVFGVHEDSKSGHLHIHYVVNSVSSETGLKWHMSKREFVEFKEGIERTVVQLLGEW